MLDKDNLARLGAKIGALLGSMTLLVVIEPDIHIKGTFEIDLGNQHAQIEAADFTKQEAAINLRFK